MTDMAKSVLDRLRNEADKSGRGFQLCLQLFCQEEFLRRLEQSGYADNFVLKGGLFIYMLTRFSSRVTIDIDFLLRRMNNAPEYVRRVMEEIISSDTGNDFVLFEIKDVNPISIEKKYQGVSVSLVARIKNTRTPINIDFGVGDVIVPGEKKMSVPTQLCDFKSPTINMYSIETTVAEKLDAVLHLMEYTSRMKDFFDLNYLSSTFDFDGNVLSQAIKSTINNRNHLFTYDRFQQFLSLANDDSMLLKWKAFERKSKVPIMAFDQVMHSIESFISEPLEHCLNNREFEKRWDKNIKCWGLLTR